MNKSRFIFASILSPLVPMALFTILPIAAGYSELDKVYPLIFIISVFFGYLGLFCFGYPVIYILNKIGRLNLLTLAASSFISGGCIFVLFLGFFGVLLDGSFIQSIQLIFSDWKIAGHSFLGGGILGLSVCIPFGVIAGITIHSTPPGKPGSDLKKPTAFFRPG